MFEIEEIVIKGVKQLSWKNVGRRLSHRGVYLTLQQFPHYRAFLDVTFPKYMDREFINAPTQYGAYDDRESVTFREVLAQSQKLAAWLRVQDIDVGDRVAIVAFNTIG